MRQGAPSKDWTCALVDRPGVTCTKLRSFNAATFADHPSSPRAAEAAMQQSTAAAPTIMDILRMAGSLTIGGRQYGLPRLSGQRQDGHSGSGAVRGIDVAAIVILHVVVHRRVETVGHAVDGRAGRRGVRSRRLDEVGDGLRILRVADVPDPHPGVEPGDADDLAVVRGING